MTMDPRLSEEWVKRFIPRLERDLMMSSGFTKVIQGTGKIARWHVPDYKPLDKDTKLTPLQCSQCAAPLPKNGWTCEYCGTSFQETPLNLSRYAVTKVKPDDTMLTTVSTTCLTACF